MSYIYNIMIIMSLYCLICGDREDEVKKLFCFPRNIHRSKLWQEALGMVYQGRMSGHKRVCDKHFANDCYKLSTQILTLRTDAVPFQFTALQDAHSRIIIHSIENLQTANLNVLSGSLLATKPRAGSENLENENLNGPSPIVTKLHTGQGNTANQIMNAPQTCSNSKAEVPTTPRKNPNLIPSSRGSGPRCRKSLFKAVDGLCSGIMTPRKKALMGIVKKKHAHLRQLKKKCRERGRRISDLTDIHKSIHVNNIFKGLSPTVAQFMISQLKCSKRSPKGRRWSMDDKIMALSIYKRSPRCYALLRRLLALPCKRTLTLLLNKVPFRVGINQHIFQHLGHILSLYPEEERLCTLAFDEMAIREHVQYNPYTDCIEGVEDFGNRRTDKLAKYALVFMAQGLSRSWKQPVAYYFSNGGMHNAMLKTILTDVLTAMHNANIPVVATICDLGSANCKMLKIMGCTESNPYFFLNERKIFTIFDPPHLLKCFRNLLQKYNVLLPMISASADSGDCEEQIAQARWSDIRQAYEIDKQTPLVYRSLHKLKDFYMAPIGKHKMKVKVAAQILSHSVSAFIFNLVSQGILPQRALATATFASELDEIFDSCNGSSVHAPDGKPYRCRVSESSGHVSFWQKSYKKISKWRFIRYKVVSTKRTLKKTIQVANTTKRQPIKTKKNGTIERSKKIQLTSKPPSHKGWMYTLKALPELWQHVHLLGLSSLRTRFLNQDSLENLFGMVRIGCGSNENPTVTQFIASLKTQVINGLTNQGLKGTNCEEDELNLLSNLRSFIEVEQSSRDENHNDLMTLDNLNFNKNAVNLTDIEAMVATGSIESLSVAYVSGFIVKRIFSKFECEICKSVLSSDYLDPFNQFIHSKEFSDTNSKLFYPSEKLVVAVGHAVTYMENNMSALRQEMDLQKKVATIIKQGVDFSFLETCGRHCDYIRMLIIESVCKISIPWYCTRIVRDLKSEASKRASERKLKKLLHS